LRLFDKSVLDRIGRWRREWEHGELKRALARSPESRQKFRTLSGIEVDGLYTPGDVDEQDFEDRLGFPGSYPFTRGAYPTMYRSRPWTRRQIAGFGTASSTNERFRFLLDHGQTGLSTDFDHPTLTGYDSDDELADGEVGRLGVAVDTIGDMDELFHAIPLDRVGISFTINHPAITMLGMFLAVAESRGVSWDTLRGTVQNDSLKEFYGQKTFALPPRPSLKLTTDIVEYCTRSVPNWYTVSISGYHTREAGADAVQELAFTLSQGMAYAESAMERGLDIDEFAPRLSYFFGCHNDLFEEVAKFRAARRMWARIVKERYKAKNPESMRMRFHTQTLGSTLVREGPQNNITRGALQALAAVLGGTQSLHISGYDEAYDIPSEDAMRVSLATQLVIAHETNVANTVDPLAGSYFVESLTDRVEEKAWEYINRIDEMGGGSMVDGMLSAIETGYIETEIANTAFEYQRGIESKERVIVGVNDYPAEAVEPAEVFEFDLEEEERQFTRLREVKAARSSAAVKRALSDVKRMAEAGENLFPYVMGAVKAYATEGEVMGALRDVYGEHVDPGVF
jgi:methylmalonyl-CoA mutase N-terminal domain/subunit